MKLIKTRWYATGFIASLAIALSFKVVDVIWVFKELEHSKTYLLISSFVILIWMAFMGIGLIDSIRSFKKKYKDED